MMVQLAFRDSPRNFFRLPGLPRRIDQATFLLEISHEDLIENFVYEPMRLDSPANPQYWRVTRKKFVNASFSSTTISRFEFQDCSFEDSLFIGSHFERCRFESCSFVRCNFFRAEFSGVYVNPVSFRKAQHRFYHANIGVYLFQQLLANSKREFQQEFERLARYDYGRWQRFQKQYQNDYTIFRRGTFRHKSGLLVNIVINRIFQTTMGYGVRAKNFITSTICITLLLSFISFENREILGLKICKFSDAIYFTIITLTTVGFGDIAPAETSGRVLIASEGVLGVFMFATLTSMVLKRLIG